MFSADLIRQLNLWWTYLQNSWVLFNFANIPAVKPTMSSLKGVPSEASRGWFLLMRNKTRNSTKSFFSSRIIFYKGGRRGGRKRMRKAFFMHEKKKCSSLRKRGKHLEKGESIFNRYISSLSNNWLWRNLNSLWQPWWWLGLSLTNQSHKYLYMYITSRG